VPTIGGASIEINGYHANDALRASAHPISASYRVTIKSSPSTKVNRKPIHFFLVIFMSFTMNVNASTMCKMYGPNNTLCQSQRLSQRYSKDHSLEVKCRDDGDDAACRELAKHRKSSMAETNKRISAEPLYRLRMDCYQFDKQEACAALEDMK